MANVGCVERGEAQAIYQAGEERCVEFILELAGGLDRIVAGNARLEERIRKLEQQIQQNSRNSSRPPSEDSPSTRQQRRAEARAKAKEMLRNAGGQPGHEGSARKLQAEDEVEEIVDHYPEVCVGCGREFTEKERWAGGRVGRHQVAELPAISVVLTEHRTHRLRCGECRSKTTAVLPSGVASRFGPRFRAAVVTLSARNRISRRDMSELAGELFGLSLSVGAVDRICQRAANALKTPHEQLSAAVLHSPAVHLDETGWRTWGESRTLWTATTPGAAIFRVGMDRHRDRLEELIGADFQGIVCSDRWWAYDHLDPECRQVCWSHLVRDFRRHAEGLALQKQFGEHGLRLTSQLFEVWHSYLEHQDRTRLKREMKPIQAELRKLLEHAGHRSKRNRYHRRFANNLLKIWPALWTFITVEDVGPTNNAAERSLRGPVIHRKLSHGTRSQNGERFVERALSASVTCRLQRRSLFAYLSDLLTAHARGDPLPALV